MLAIAVLLALIPILVAISLLRSGLTARQAPGQAENWIGPGLRRLAMPRADRTMKNPFSPTPELLNDARHHFADHCASCHANDGSGNTMLGNNLNPRAPDTRLASTQSQSDGELYFVIHNGIRFTGMPAWGNESPDNDSWKLVLFIRHLPQITTEEINDMQKYNPQSETERAEQQEEEDFLNRKPANPQSEQAPHRH
jgi:hypothetical protein